MPRFTPDQMLDMTQTIKRQGWTAIYVRQQGMFKVSKRDYHMLMDPEMFEEIFITRANRCSIRRGVSRERHGYRARDLHVGQMLIMDDEYYVVLAVGCINTQGEVKPWRDGAIIAHVCREDLALCNMQLNPAEDGIDSTMRLSTDIRIDNKYLN